MMPPVSRRPALALVAAMLIVLAAVGGACSGGSKSSPTATAGGKSQLTTTVRAASATASVGSEAQAAVQALAVGAPGLGAWTIEVAYDPALLAATTCEGTEFSACNTQKDDRTVRLAGATGTGLQGDVTLMTLTFQCKAAGTSALKVSIEVLADATVGNPLSIDATTQDGSITCA